MALVVQGMRSTRLSELVVSTGSGKLPGEEVAPPALNYGLPYFRFDSPTDRERLVLKTPQDKAAYSFPSRVIDGDQSRELFFTTNENGIINLPMTTIAEATPGSLYYPYRCLLLANKERNGTWELDNTPDSKIAYQVVNQAGIDACNCFPDWAGQVGTYRETLEQALQIVPELRNLLLTLRAEDYTGDPLQFAPIGDLRSIIGTLLPQCSMAGNAINWQNAGALIPTLNWTNRGRGGFLFLMHGTTQTVGQTWKNYGLSCGTLEDFGLDTDEKILARVNNTKWSATGTKNSEVSIWGTASMPIMLESEYTGPAGIEDFKPGSLHRMDEAKPGSDTYAESSVYPALISDITLPTADESHVLRLYTEFPGYSSSSYRLTPLSFTSAEITAFSPLLSQSYDTKHPLNYRADWNKNVYKTVYTTTTELLNILPVVGAPYSTLEAYREWQDLLAINGLDEKTLSSRRRLYARPTYELPVVQSVFDLFSAVYYKTKVTNATNISGTVKYLTSSFDSNGKLIVLDIGYCKNCLKYKIGSAADLGATMPQLQRCTEVAYLVPSKKI